MRAGAGICCVAALLLIGTGATRPGVGKLAVTDGGRIVFDRVPVPRSPAPAIGTDNFFFLTPLHGFAATTGGAGWIPKVGYQQPYDAGRIERTDDGGASWRTVWHGRHVVFSVISFADAQVGVAAGAVNKGRNYSGSPGQTPVLVSTRDGGRSWQRLPRPPFSRDFFLQGMYDIDQSGTVQAPSPTVWYAFAPDLSWPGRRAALWRTTDAGLHWQRSGIPRGTTTVTFRSASTGYAAARPRSCRAAQQLWKTIDGGASWKPVARLPRSVARVDERVRVRARCEAACRDRPRDPGRRTALADAADQQGLGLLQPLADAYGPPLRRRAPRLGRVLRVGPGLRVGLAAPDE